jgi:phosphatidylcholine synthase
MDAMTSARSSPLRTGLAWGVHAFTASGAVVAVLALLASAAGEYRAAVLWMLVALAIDAVDGTLARAVRVKEALPGVDGRRLDDVVDYLNYAVVPAVFLVACGAVPHWGFAAVPVLASAYGFSQASAKTDDHFFLGFPSYWNVVAIYAFGLDLAPAATAALLLVLSVLVFVPLKYVYPSRTRRLRLASNAGAGLWTALVAAAFAFPERLAGAALLELSLVYPAYYLAVSCWLGEWFRRDAAAAPPSARS